MIFLGFFDSLGRTVLWVLAIVPLAANTVAFASEMNLHPEKTATAVVISTVLAVFTVPLIAPLLFWAPLLTSFLGRLASSGLCSQSARTFEYAYVCSHIPS